ncbi:MAG: hypothetical protein KAS77_01785 [Thermoplasmata archaeon]|nr:hypothetical protein [Thermoplasmata archaeon]
MMARRARRTMKRRKVLRRPHKSERLDEEAIGLDESGWTFDDIMISTPNHMDGNPFVKMLLARYKTTGGRWEPL